jgi:transketolase
MLMDTKKAVGAALVSQGKIRKDFVVLDGDLSGSTQTFQFAEAYPDRFVDCGIAEMNMMGMAAGLASCGVIPVVSTFSVFASMKACEQIRTFICYPNLNVKIIGSYAGIDVGEAGVTHQATEDMAILRSFPNMHIISPSDGPEAEAAVEQMFRIEGPVYLRLGRSPLPVYHDAGYRLSYGKAELLREGSDAAIMATGPTVPRALEAADLLKKNGIRTEVINIPFIKPMDQEQIMRTAAKVAVIFTVEDHTVIGGLGSAVLEILGDKDLQTPVVRLGLQDVFGTSGTPDLLYERYGIDGPGIAAAVTEFFAD